MKAHAILHLKAVRLFENQLTITGEPSMVPACLFCQKNISDKRTDAIFCSRDCKDNFYLKAKKEKIIFRAERRRILALQFISQNPEVIIWIANKCREDIRLGYRIQFRINWELSKREFNLHPSDHNEVYVKENVLRTYPDLAPHIHMKGKKP